MAEKLMAEVYAARAAAGQPLRPWNRPPIEQSPPAG